MDFTVLEVAAAACFLVAQVSILCLKNIDLHLHMKGRTHYTKIMALDGTARLLLAILFRA